MYDRGIYESLGGFTEKAIFNEDMIYASKALRAGYASVYQAAARVYHAHDYTAGQQFHRNFDLGMSQAMHPEVFEDVSSESEGKSYAKSAYKYFKDHGKPLVFIPFAATCAFRLAGYKLGKNYKKLTRRQILKCTASPTFFYKHWS